MRRWTCILIVAALCEVSCTRLRMPKDAAWHPKSGAFVWWRGQVKLPVGFTYQVDQGADSFVGHFTSADGRLIVRDDIGGYAGVYADREQSRTFRATVVGGARVWVAKRDWPDGKGKGGITTLAAVTFPDSGYANFLLASSRPEDAVVIDFIADSFQ